MIAKILSYALTGLNGIPVSVEVDINNGLPSFDIVGLADTSVKESKERVRAAIKNSGRLMPVKKITANLAPADVKKEGSALDLALAIGVLKASSQIIASTDGYVFLGELSLDGSLRRVNGVLPIIISAVNEGYDKFIIPKGNEKEASFIENAETYAADNLNEVIDHLSGLSPLPRVELSEYVKNPIKNIYDCDLSFVKGQKTAKRALEVAVSGGHNLLFVGAPGTGKTMLAKCIPTIMPDMTKEEALETTKIHSVYGILNDKDGIVKVRPFRSPHHTSTTVSMTGGGSDLRPGEISLAHNGVLFLDEMPEYTRSALEALRQPLEDGVISISRATGSVKYPANFILCGSMNPCPCGNYGSEDKECTCTPSQIAKYKAKISGPLLDRIDIHVEVAPVEYNELSDNNEGEKSRDIKKRVDKARAVQQKRFAGTKITCNAKMTPKMTKEYCVLSEEADELLHESFDNFSMSARAYDKVLRLARTIADLADSEEIKLEHIAEALQFRALDRKYWEV